MDDDEDEDDDDEEEMADVSGQKKKSEREIELEQGDDYILGKQSRKLLIWKLLKNKLILP